MQTHALILSPHLDDAVLSTTARLAAGAAHVATVFAGVPAADGPLAEWDRLTGAIDSAQRQRDRIAEDAAALELLPVTAERWDHLDAQYRPGTRADRAAIARQISELIGAYDELWLPAGIGHDDHAAVCDAGLDAARRAGRATVTLYADVPHAIPYGWPPSVTGGAPRPYLDSDAWLQERLRERGFETSSLVTHTVPLDEALSDRKWQALQRYRTQLDALGLSAEDVSRDPHLLRYELCWTLTL